MPLNQTPNAPLIKGYRSTQFIWCLLDIKDCPLFLPFNPIILDHPTINSRVLALKLQHRFRRHSFEDEVVITVWTVLVAFFEFFGVFAESLFALLTGEGLVFLVGVARRGVLIMEERGKIPFLISGAAGGSRFLGGTQRNRTIFDLEICQDLNTLD